MRQTDRNRLNRLPTVGERRLGIVLAAAIAVSGLSVGTFLLLGTLENWPESASLAVAASLFLLLGVAGLFLLYRLVFTPPAAASSLANEVFAWVAVFVAAVMLVVSLILPLAVAERAMALLLFCVALSYVANANRIRRAVARK